MLDRFHEGMAGVLLSMHVSDIRPYGEIVSDSDGRVQAFREKQPTCRAGYVNGAIYLFDKSIAKAFPMGEFRHFVKNNRPVVQDMSTVRSTFSIKVLLRRFRWDKMFFLWSETFFHIFPISMHYKQMRIGSISVYQSG
jgi:NDP-sugar pyrophosphorylase family protein